jgi:hypothetical protein
MKRAESGVTGIDPGAVTQPIEQLRYALWLDWGTRFGLAVLVLVFLAYGLGLAEPHVPHERLQEVWNLPVSDFLVATGLPTGWGWVAHAHRSDIANLIGIAMLTGCSLLALLVLLPLYARRGDRVYLGICVAQIAVLLLAASGVLTAGH